MGPDGGPADSGLAFVGDWTEAARFFGAIEAYSDNHVYNGIVAPAGGLEVPDPSPDKSSLVLTRLQNWYLPDGQQVWYPTYLFSAFHDAKLFQSAPCVAG